MRFLDTALETSRLSARVIRPIAVSSTLWFSMSTRYTTIMTVLSMTGAKVSTSVPAMDAFIGALVCMAPAILCEKNSIGSLRTFHIYVVLPMTSILPLILSEYIACAHSTIICRSANPSIAAVNGYSQSGLVPLSSLSMKILPVTELTMPNR